MSIEKLTWEPLSIGIELPLDNDWSTSGQLKRQQDGRPFGVPDMSEHAARIKLADELGFRAAWVRDVPLYDPDFGDAAQVFETFTYLGYLSSLTRNILLGTAAVVLPLRQPWLVRKAASTLQTLSGDRLLLGVASGDRPWSTRCSAPITPRAVKASAPASAFSKGKPTARCNRDCACCRPRRRRRCWSPGWRNKRPSGWGKIWMAGCRIPARLRTMFRGSNSGAT
ncbi:LLM class flavin-dependent oxidoreductase [Serratia ureilytica]